MKQRSARNNGGELGEGWHQGAWRGTTTHAAGAYTYTYTEPAAAPEPVHPQEMRGDAHEVLDSTHAQLKGCHAERCKRRRGGTKILCGTSVG